MRHTEFIDSMSKENEGLLTEILNDKLGLSLLLNPDKRGTYDAYSRKDNLLIEYKVRSIEQSFELLVKKPKRLEKGLMIEYKKYVPLIKKAKEAGTDCWYTTVLVEPALGCQIAYIYIHDLMALDEPEWGELRCNSSTEHNNEYQLKEDKRVGFLTPGTAKLITVELPEDEEAEALWISLP